MTASELSPKNVIQLKVLENVVKTVYLDVKDGHKTYEAWGHSRKWSRHWSWNAHFFLL